MFTKGWEKDWHIVDGDKELSMKLIPWFELYLTALKEKGSSKSTMNRHINACHAIGGHIIDNVFKYEWDSLEIPWDGEEILFKYVFGFDGPLIYQDSETLQKQIDTTSRKLYNFLLKGTV